ncbi:MAG: DUF4924 family protein [Flavobacteriales bacterium]
MTLAAQKLKQNISEYVLFVWQMEDLLRAVYFDTHALSDFVRTYAPNEAAYEEEMKWFHKLHLDMKREGVEHRGHVSEVHELLFELAYLHNTLLNLSKDEAYTKAYMAAQPNIIEYKSRTDGSVVNDVEVCLTALYGLLVLRLKKEPISADTEQAMKSFSQLLAMLSHHYKLMKQGSYHFSLN